MRDLVDCARILLEAGADPRLKDFDSEPQRYAVSYNQPEILAMLLAAGGDAIVDDVLAAGWTDLARAASFGHVELCSLLLAAGADVNRRVKNSLYDHSPLHFAIEGGHERLFAILLKAGATIPSESLHDPYFRKVDAAGGFRAYEKAHRKLLTNTFATKLPRLPIEVVSHFVSFAFHTGYY